MNEAERKAYARGYVDGVQRRLSAGVTGDGHVELLDDNGRVLARLNPLDACKLGVRLDRAWREATQQHAEPSTPVHAKGHLRLLPGGLS